VKLRDRIKTAVANRDAEELEAAVAESPRCLRHLMGMTYDVDPEVRALAARGIAIAARFHPRKVKEQVERLVWSMDNRANTNAVGAPDVLRAIAEEHPDMLLPLVADLARLARQPLLQDGIAAVLQTLTDKKPGEVGRRMSADLTEKMHSGVCDV
jgi:hypothetical protein